MTTHLTMVVSPTDPDAWVVVLTQMQGDRVVKRKTSGETFISKNECLDELMRLATRCFYFNEGESLLES